MGCTFFSGPSWVLLFRHLKSLVAPMALCSEGTNGVMIMGCGLQGRRGAGYKAWPGQMGYRAVYLRPACTGHTVVWLCSHIHGHQWQEGQREVGGF